MSPACWFPVVYKNRQFDMGCIFVSHSWARDSIGPWLWSWSWTESEPRCSRVRSQ